MSVSPGSDDLAYIIAALHGTSFSLPRTPASYISLLFDLETQRARFYKTQNISWPPRVQSKKEKKGELSSLFHEVHGLMFQSSVPLELKLMVTEVMELPLLPNDSSRTNVSYQWLDILDLGCGRGGAGYQFIDYANRLTGIDLSKRALIMAMDLHVYDDMLLSDFETELQTFHFKKSSNPNNAASLSTETINDEFDAMDLPKYRKGEAVIMKGSNVLRPHGFDIILAADSIPYFGNLEDIFTGVSTLLRDGGVFAFNVDLGYVSSSSSTITPQANEINPKLQFTGRW
eukprot:CAMPEP_0114365372 /NCGR_PEP_ID=MMETSP0101-20121206/28360_1 /TAXON_ID=38822 ORGANISM="Pteridomonas danica, Strain PT" /NCGR_SAMPLE_ID=MMETSP0101 /ASSEMBLY_ACC=CAM_ASM_000211 /LENGTH=286 /DNA_ID=CAMNT_0001513667 /DNA_START=386 /DNA_END=1243 /DNA_ORIENTATION=-